MKNTSARRDFLKWSGAGLAAAATGAIPAVAAQQAQQSGSRIPLYFDVHAFGAKGDGKTIDSPAINAAIDAAAAVGGGMVYFPAGVYASYSIRLKSMVHLCLSQGATILAAPSPERGAYAATGYYDPPEPNPEGKDYQDFGHCHWHNSLIWGDGLSDISVTGPGLIWGKGLTAGQRADQLGVGNKSIALKNCRNVLLRDFSILQGGHFGLLLTGVDNLTIDNLKIDTNRDGMDIDCCRNVRVSNCTVNSPMDDGICPKSSYALGYNRSTDNVTITNCFVTGIYQIGTVLDGTFKKYPPEARVFRTGRIKCGTESNGGFRNIAISNCVFEGCQGLALESVDGALLEDISITNITMRDIITAPIFLRLGARLRGPAGTKVGTLRRVLIDNLVSYNTAEKITGILVGRPEEHILTPWTTPYQISSVLSGVPGSCIEDVKIANVFVQNQGGAPAEAAKVQPPERETFYPEPTMFGPTPAHGFYIRHAKHVELSHVEVATVQPDARPTIVLDDVERADFIHLEAPYLKGQPTISVRETTGLRVLQNRNLDDVYLREHIGQKDL
jgi:polygalacturonase